MRLFFMWCEEVGQFDFFCLWLSSFPNMIYGKDCLFPIVYSCLLCHRFIDHECMGLFLALFCCIFLFLYHTSLITLAL